MVSTPRIIILLALIFFLYVSCTKPDISFGADYLDNNYTNIVMIDTATASVSTVLIDSFITSASGKALIGKYKDPYFGSVTSETYLQLAPPSFEDVYANTTYDSLEIIVRPNKSFYGDTTQPLTLQIDQLAEPIAFGENKTSLYNVNAFAVNTTPLGSRTLRIRPSVTDSISIRISDVLGNDLLNKLQEKDDIIKSSDQFLNYFKGIRISSANTNAAMFGFSDSSIVMRLHYSEKGLVLQSKSIDFTLFDNTHQFNHITVDRAGTALSSLSPANSEIASSQTNNAGYLQTSTGSIVKIGFPYLRNFLTINNFLKIEKAELIIEPVKNTFSGIYPLPPLLRLSETTQLNEMGTDVTTSASGTAAAQYGDLVIDDLYGQNTNYTYDVTNYVDTLIANANANKNGLLISPPAPSYQSDFNRLLIGDKNNQQGSIKLKIYYLTVNQN